MHLLQNVPEGIMTNAPATLDSNKQKHHNLQNFGVDHRFSALQHPWDYLILFKCFVSGWELVSTSASSYFPSFTCAYLSERQTKISLYFHCVYHYLRKE